MGLRDAFLSLSSKTNSVEPLDKQFKEGAIGEALPELRLDMEDQELIKLSKTWRKSWESYYPELKRRQDKAVSYWKGKPTQSLNLSEDPLADNLIFEALETFIPLANKQNPEPVCDSDDTKEGQQFARDLQRMLAFQADRQTLALKLQRGVRHWSLKLFGVWKIGWNAKENDIETIALDPKVMILDKDASISEKGEYQGEYIGEQKEMTASALISMFPDKAEYITEKAGGKDKLGTKLGYIEWWTDEITFNTLGEEVLSKSQNYHFNYEQRETVDEYGRPLVLDPKNHFPSPKKPYVFLSVFSLGEHPHDDTSLIEQNIANQNRINKRTQQIDKNADRTNGGIVLDSNQFDKEKGAAAVDALRQGMAILAEKPSESVVFTNATALPQFVYDDKEDARRELRNIFGTSGSSAQGIKAQDTARGKILAKGADDSRVGGGVTKYIEQVADSIFNWWAQMMVVYYTDAHYASVLGEANTKEFISLSSEDFRKVFISVKEGSLIPTDELTRRNEAVELWQAGAIDPIELYTRLKFPDPQKAAERLYMWNNAPQMLFPEAGQAVAQAQQVATMQQAQPAMEQSAPEQPQEMNDPLSQVQL